MHLPGDFLRGRTDPAQKAENQGNRWERWKRERGKKEYNVSTWGRCEMRARIRHCTWVAGPNRHLEGNLSSRHSLALPLVLRVSFRVSWLLIFVYSARPESEERWEILSWRFAPLAPPAPTVAVRRHMPNRITAAGIIGFGRKREIPTATRRFREIEASLRTFAMPDRRCFSVR